LAIFKSEKFEIEDAVAVYEYDFLSKNAEWEVKVGALSGEIIESNHEDKNIILMFFIRLFAKIGIFF